MAGGCSRPLTLQTPALSGADARACADLVDGLPRRVDGQRIRRAETGAGSAAAWGDPAIELRCGVRRPAGLDAFAQCQTTNGVDWFIPEEQLSGGPEDITMTTVGRAQYVEVRLPRDYWPPADAMVDLAQAVKTYDREVRPCQ